MTATAKQKTTIQQEVGQVMKLMQDFGSLLKKETAALRKADLKSVDGLQQRKRELATEYHQQVGALSTRASEITALDLSSREKLVRARTDFTVILNENLRALETTKKSTQRLVDRIMHAARAAVKQHQQTSYSAAGQAQSYKTSGLSLNMDHTL